VTWQSFVEVKNDKQLFTYLGKNYRYDFFLPVATCVALCERKDVVVNNIEYSSRHIHMECSDANELVIPGKLRFPEDNYMIEVKE